MPEILMVILVMGILAAVVVPGFINAQNEANAQPVKAKLQSAAILIEQEQLDNNGLYPKYVPNELKQDSIMKDFVYTYSDDRTKFCLQARSTIGKLFVSSENKNVTSTTCTQSNLAEGGATPWETPTITTPTVSSASNTWPNSAAYATASVSTTAATCTLNSSDTAEWGPHTIVQYRVKISNTTTGEFINTDWGTSRSFSVPLTGWLPNNVLTYQAQSRCVISNGIDYQYSSPLSASVNGKVSAFTVTTPTLIAPTADWTSNTAFNIKASWTNPVCPAGTKQRLYKVLNNGTAGAGFDTTWAGWTTSDNRNVTSWSSGGTTTFSIQLSCLLPDGQRFSSGTSTATYASNLRPPVAPAGLSTGTTIISTTVSTPTTLSWTAVSCDAGTVEYVVYRTSPTAYESAPQASRTFNLGTLPVGQNHTYNVKARCVNGAMSSALSAASSPVTFTPQSATPATPSVPGSITHNITTSIVENTGRTISWNSVECTAGAAVSYRVQRVVLDDATLATPNVSGWINGTTYDIPTSWLKYGSTVGFQVQSRCVNPVAAPVSAWSGTVKGTLGVASPAAPSVSNNGDAGVSWSTVSCSAGTSPQYLLTQTKYGDIVGNWVDGTWQTGTSKNLSVNFRQGNPLIAKVEARCVGANYTSGQGAAGSTSWTSRITSMPNPIYMSGGGYANYTLQWSGGWNCPTGTAYSGFTFRSDSTWSGWRNIVRNFNATTYSTTRSRFPDGTYYWARVEQRCYTKWVNGPLREVQIGHNV